MRGHFIKAGILFDIGINVAQQKEDQLIALKQTIILILFFIAALSSFVLTFIYNDTKIDFLSSLDPADKSERESYFFDVEYFRNNKANPYLYLKSKNLTFNGTGDIFFVLPQGDLYTDSGEKVNYKAMTGRFGKDINLLNLKESVSMKFNTHDITSNYISYSFEEGKVTAIGDVFTKSYSESTKDSIEIKSEKMISWPKKNLAEYRQKVKGDLIRRKAYEEGIKFEADRIVLSLDDSVVKLFDDVKIDRQNLNATSRSGEIFMENYNKKLKYFALYDDVKVKEKVVLDGGRFIREAFAEKLEGIAGEDKIILTGYPKVFQKKDIIKGNVIVLRENNEVVEVDDASTNFILRKN